MRLPKCLKCCRKNSNRECILPNNIIIITTSLNSNRIYARDSRRLRWLLNAKNIPYEDIDLSIINNKNEVNYYLNMFKKAKVDLPAIYINMEYFGNYEKVQDLEDHSELDDFLFYKEIKSKYEDHSMCWKCHFD